MNKYTITIYGYGAELVAGTISNEEVNKINEAMEENGFEELSELYMDWDVLGEKEIQEWHETDNLFHSYGPFASDSKVTVTNSETYEEVYESELDELPHAENANYIEAYHDVEDKPIMWGKTEDKGVIFETEIEIEGEFDPEKFTFDLIGHMVEDDGEYVLADNFHYDGEEIYNDGCSTDTKAFDVVIYE